MRTLFASTLLAATLAAPAMTPAPHLDEPAWPHVAAICFFQYETTSGMNKICYYDCLGSPAAITISSVSLCPLSISR